MIHASSISPEHRAGLRRLRAEFEAAFDAVADAGDRSSAAYHEADARYRAWVKAMDAVAVALLDDIDAFEAAGRERGRGPDARLAETRIEASDVDRLFAGIDDLRRTADLIGTPGPSAAKEPRTPTARSRAMGVIGLDRMARHASP